MNCIEKVEHNGKLLAIIIRRNYSSTGIKFFTPNDFSQQLGYMNRPKGYCIQPHIHNQVKREVSYTQEVLLVKSGKVKVDFFDQEKIFLESKIIFTGDVILLAHGGHGFEMLEATEMIEVKQGPYSSELDKKLL
jgi:hypothetical protein